MLELISAFLATAMKPSPENEGDFLARKQAVEAEHRPIVEAIRAGDADAARSGDARPPRQRLEPHRDARGRAGRWRNGREWSERGRLRGLNDPAERGWDDSRSAT